eukprot:CAMPEP_0171233642 /NCGR_PEP_ID=MMETSP0790-20130122/41025_1 /TAXON_ID=2925 /ORGANISM="Alexandrium catenella, Strain OF101" /LENGTH=34 /DNA_ID= /DNA_START= /DNA_END= /DNA_ORIENTATION=
MTFMPSLKLLSSPPTKLREGAKISGLPSSGVMKL